MRILQTRSTENPYQHTIKTPVSCRGVGLHSGKTVNMSIRPGAANTGIRFLRSDLGGDRFIPAFMNRVVDTMMATTIAEGDVRISTTEHVLSALTGLGIDNAIIELDAAEIPIMDGSAVPFVHLLKKAGIRQQKSYRRLVKISREISFADGDRIIRIVPHDGYKITAVIDFNHGLINRQECTIELSPDEFVHEISSARTFGFIDEVEKLQKNGLALGASLDNAVGMDRAGILNEEGLRFDDEFVRHKILDIIGDLTLLGCPLLGHVIAYKSGHGQHLRLMQEIAANPSSWDFVELNKNGQLSVLNKMVAAGQRLLPFLVPQQQLGA